MVVPSKRAPGRTEVAVDALIHSLFQEHGNAMMAYAFRLTGDRGAAEDIVQETLVRAWRHPDSLVNGKGSVRGWLFTVVRNLVTDKARARASRYREVALRSDDDAVVRDHSGHVVDAIVVGEAMRRLSRQHREVLAELYLFGSTGVQTAQALGIPPGTVKSRSHYALRALRTFLER